MQGEGSRGYLTSETRAFVGENELEAVAVTGKPNRYKEIMSVQGLDLTNYRKNPVVTWMHSWQSFPVGKATQVDVSGTDLIFRTEFAPTNEGQAVKGLYRDGFLSAFSIGFMVHGTERIDPAQSGGAEVRISSSELLEIAAVVVPVDPNALSGVMVRSLGELWGVGFGEQESPPPDEWSITLQRMQHIVSDLRNGRKENPTDKAMLFEVAARAASLLEDESDVAGAIQTLASNFNSGDVWEAFERTYGLKLPDHQRLEAAAKRIINLDGR